MPFIQLTDINDPRLPRPVYVPIEAIMAIRTKTTSRNGTAEFESELLLQSSHTLRVREVPEKVLQIIQIARN